MSVAETVSTSDEVSVFADFVGNAIEASSASDLVSSVYEVASGVSESSSLVEVVSSANVVSVQVNEAASSTDVLDAEVIGQQYNESVSESGSALSVENASVDAALYSSVIAASSLSASLSINHPLGCACVAKATLVCGFEGEAGGGRRKKKQPDKPKEPETLQEQLKKLNPLIRAQFGVQKPKLEEKAIEVVADFSSVDGQESAEAKKLGIQTALKTTGQVKKLLDEVNEKSRKTAIQQEQQEDSEDDIEEIMALAMMLLDE